MLESPKAIGTVSRMWADVTYSSFTDSLVKMLLFSERKLCKENEYIHYDAATVSYHQMARNQLVSSFRGEWILTLDSDHTWSPCLLIRLLEIMKESGAGVVSGMYQSKFPPHVPVANLWNDKGELVQLLDWDRSLKYFPIGAVGGGCMLISKETLQKLGPDPFNQIGGFSEDYSFCARCKEANIPIVLAPNIQCHHTIRTVLAIEDYIPPPNVPVANLGGQAIDVKT